MAAPSYDGAAAAASVVISPTVRERPVLFVEGACEIRLLAHHFPNHETQIIACGGHAGVKDAISAIELWEMSNGTSLAVLGFIDRDYGVRTRCRRITVSNYRDVEIDLYKSSAGVRLLKEKASQKKCSDFRATVDEAIETLRAIGLIRKHNSDAGRNLSINEINLDGCMSRDGRIDIEKYLSVLQQRNRLSKEDLSLIRSFLAARDDVMAEEVVRGHDVSTVLAKWLRKKIGNRQKAETTREALEENLRLATERDELLRYHWARRIKEHLTRQIQRTR